MDTTHKLLHIIFNWLFSFLFHWGSHQLTEFCDLSMWGNILHFLCHCMLSEASFGFCAGCFFLGGGGVVVSNSLFKVDLVDGWSLFVNFPVKLIPLGTDWFHIGYCLPLSCNNVPRGSLDFQWMFVSIFLLNRLYFDVLSFGVESVRVQILYRGLEFHRR